MFVAVVVAIFAIVVGAFVHRDFNRITKGLLKMIVRFDVAVRGPIRINRNNWLEVYHPLDGMWYPKKPVVPLRHDGILQFYITFHYEGRNINHVTIKFSIETKEGLALTQTDSSSSYSRDLSFGYNFSAPAPMMRESELTLCVKDGILYLSVPNKPEQGKIRIGVWSHNVEQTYEQRLRNVQNEDTLSNSLFYQV